MYFVDEDGSQIDIIDGERLSKFASVQAQPVSSDSDWDSAIDAARELGGGRSEGKVSPHSRCKVLKLTSAFSNS